MLSIGFEKASDFAIMQLTEMPFPFNFFASVLQNAWSFVSPCISEGAYVNILHC